MRRLFFLVVVLFLSSFVYADVDGCWSNNSVGGFYNLADCNGGGGIWCDNQPVGFKCRCLFESDNQINCEIGASQIIDVSLKGLTISSGFLYFDKLTINTNVKLSFINGNGFSNQANFLDNAAVGGVGGGSYGKSGGQSGVGGKIAAAGKSGKSGSGSGHGGGGNAANSAAGGAIGLVLDSLILNGEISVSGENANNGGSCSTCAWDNWGNTAGGGGGAGGPGGGLLMIQTNSYSYGEGVKLTANGGNGGSGGNGCTTCLSLHSGGGGAGGGGGSGGEIYFKHVNGESQPYASQLEVNSGSGGSGGVGRHSATDGLAGSAGVAGATFGSYDWNLSVFTDLDMVSLAESIELDLTKFWDYPEVFNNDAMDQARLSKAWMRGYPYHTLFKDALGNNVLEVTRKYAPVLFFADFMGSTNLDGIVETRPPYEISNKIIENYKGVSSGALLLTEATVKQYFYDGGPVIKQLLLGYDPDIFAPSEITFFNKQLDGSDIKTTEKTIFDKKDLIMGYKGSKSTELFGVNPSLTNKIVSLERYIDDILVSQENITYMILDVDDGSLQPFSFYTSSITVGLLDPSISEESFMVACSFPSRGNECYLEREESIGASPYSFNYEVYSNKNDFWCLRSSNYLDISSWIVDCDIKFGRALPDNYLFVPKRTDKFFDSDIINEGLEERVYSEILEFDNFGRPLRTKNFDGTIINVRRDDRGRVYKQWYDNLTSEEQPHFENFYNKYGFIKEQKVFSSDFSNLYFYDDNNLLLERAAYLGDTEDSPSVIYEFDLNTLPKKYVTKSKISEGVYTEEITFKNVNGLVLQKQVRSSGTNFVVKHLEYEDGKLWREYSPFSSSSSGNFVSLLPPGLEFKEYSYAADPTGRILSVKFEDGNFKTYEYSSKSTINGKLPVIIVTEPNGVKTRYTFDLSNKLLLVEQGYNGVFTVSATWEEGIDTETIIDPLDREITVIKDGAGNILKKEHFDSGAIILKFDGVFRTLSLINPIGTKTDFYYREGTNILSSQIMDKNEDFGPFNAECVETSECGGGEYICVGGFCQ